MVAVGEARLSVVRTFTYFKLKAGVDHEQTIRCSLRALPAFSLSRVEVRL